MRYLAFRCNIIPNYGIIWDGTANSGKLVSRLGGGSKHTYRCGAWGMSHDAQWQESEQAIFIKKAEGDECRMC
jgi:hypothetical protein